MDAGRMGVVTGLKETGYALLPPAAASATLQLDLSELNSL